MKCGSPEYTRAWRDKHKERLIGVRKEKYAKRKSRRDRRYYWLNKYKVSKGCVRCGYKEHPVSLDFDHIDPTSKNFTIARRIDLSTLSVLFSEIRKCQILCANCHRIKTYEDLIAKKA